MPKRSLKVTPGKVKLIIDQPIDMKKYNFENHNELVEQVRTIIIKNYDDGKDTTSSNVKDTGEKSFFNLIFNKNN